MKAKIKISTVSNTQISQLKKEGMWQVYHQYYHYSRDSFMDRINKNNYYAMYTINEEIVGFTGLRIDRLRILNKRVCLVYFGQTVIAKQYRGKSLLPRTGMVILGHFWKDFLRSKVYFWADSLTYKAYLVFAKSLTEYYPTYKQETPEPVNALLHYIGNTHYAETFNPALKTVEKDTKWVNDSYCARIPQVQSDPDVAFYAQANPNNHLGHGLLTITPMHFKNFIFLAKKLLLGMRKKSRIQQKLYAPKSITIAQ